MGAQNWKLPNRDMQKFFEIRKYLVQAQNCSKQVKLIENKKNKPLCRLELQTIISHCLSSDCHVGFIGTKNVSSTHAQNFWKVNKSQWQEKCGRNHKCISS